MLRNRTNTVIIIPCYNESSRLPKRDFIQFFGSFPEVSFCFVNDGSSDNTNEILEDLGKNRENQVAIIDLESNKGKAEAIRSGIKHVLSWQHFEFVGYWDADLSTPLGEIPRFIEILKQSSSIQFVCGSRVRRMGADVKRNSWFRHYLGRIFATFSSLVLDLPIYDTQCGAKLIKVELAGKIFEEPFLSKWFFDVELLARAIIALGHKESKQAIFELPLQKWHDEGESRLKPYHFLRAPWELLRIFLSYKHDLRTVRSTSNNIS